MISHFTERLGLGLGITRDALGMYLTSATLILVALVPTMVRSVQVLQTGTGIPEGNIASEALVGFFRVLLAGAIILVSLGWTPLSEPFTLPASDGFASAWADGNVDWGEMVIDLVVYALVFGGLNILLGLVLTDDLLGGLWPAADDATVAVRIGLVQFIVKNLLVIPVATIHILWAIRLIERPG